jgi:tetratricopeptide (TPR) repeat protein
MPDPEYKPEIIEKAPAPDRFAETPRLHNIIGDWWREATGQTSEWHHDLSRGRAILRRIMLWSPAVVVVALVSGGLGVFLFTGWRAQDLAAKALASLDRGDQRLALIQAESARNLRKNHPDVLRAYAKVRFAAGDPVCLEVWQQLAAQGPLSLEDRQAQAEAAVRFGGEDSFDTAIAEFEATGRKADADTWRGRRALQQKDFTAAEQCFRQAAAADPTAERRIELAQLLVTIGTADSRAEAVQIIDSMASGPDASEALAFGLSSVPAGPATRRGWAERVLVDPKSNDPAVITAANVLVDDRLMTVDQIVDRLQIVFTGARLEDRGRYAQWLLQRNRPTVALDFVRPSEVRGSRGGYLVRAEALSATQDWKGLLDMVKSGSPLSDSVTNILRARAEEGLGRPAAAAASLRKAIRASVPRGSLAETMAEVDRMGKQSLSDEVLLELCGEYASAEYALRIARWRFSSRGEPRLRQEAYLRAVSAAPKASTVADLARLERLLNREPVDTKETAAALQSEPDNIDFRLTHALALFADGRAVEARTVLEPQRIVQHQLQPGQKAIAVAVLAATGMKNEAVRLARSMTPDHLTDAEYRLVFAFTTSDAPGEFFGGRESGEGKAEKRDEGGDLKLE